MIDGYQVQSYLPLGEKGLLGFLSTSIIKRCMNSEKEVRVSKFMATKSGLLLDTEALSCGYPAR